MDGPRGARARHRATAAVVAALALVACADDGGGGGDARPAQARDVARGAGLPGEVQDFLALAARGLDATYQVTYDHIGPDGEGRMVVTQRPPDRRVDITSADGAVATTLLVAGSSYQCARSPAGAWQCAPAPGGTPAPVAAFDEDAVDGTTRALTEAREHYDFVVEARDVSGVPATCLVTTLKPGRPPNAARSAAGTLCLSPEGATVWVERPGERLAATAYATVVDDGLFTLPAAVP